jgi:hypothetical protein
VRRITEKRARRRIGKLIKKTGVKKVGEKIRSKFLQSVCSDSGVCIAFGKERKKIFDFFDGFTRFGYLKSIKAIGKVSANGFVKELEYEREGYKAHAILKSSKEKDADNLMYEYLIGANVNNLLLKYFPCFIETYGHYRYRNESDWAQFQRATPGRQDLNSMLIPYQKNTVNYPESCKYSKTVCVLVQHIKGAASIGDKVIKNPPDFNYIINDLLYSFYQVYYTLAMVYSNFTHYDLHYENVGLVKLPDGYYVDYEYNVVYNGQPAVINFKSKYIVKIIDYGRCYFTSQIPPYHTSKELIKTIGKIIYQENQKLLFIKEI